MKTRRTALISLAAAAFLSIRAAFAGEEAIAANAPHRVDPAQIAAWTDASDLEFFLHGTMSSEFIPERVLRAFETANPDLFPGESLAALGVMEDDRGDLPLGFSRRAVPHLGGLPSVGINCAACHVGEVQEAPDRPSIRVLGRPSRFNIYAFSGSVAVSLARACQPEGMAKFLEHFLLADDEAGEEARKLFAAEIEKQKEALKAAVAADPFASKGIPPGGLHPITGEELALDGKRLERGADLPAVARSHLKLFHNIRTALHIPEELPGPLSTLPGPGRTDAFGVLAASFFNFPTRFEAPVKFGITWNLAGRKWVHWDANNNDPLARNLGAALGLGAPLAGGGKLVDFPAVERHTRLSEGIRSPRYPWTIDRDKASRGEGLYRENCARCHDAEGDGRLFSLEEVKTDPHRALFFDDVQADLLNKWVRDLKVPGYSPAPKTFRSTRKYWASSMDGVWARSPYLHNGSVRTLWELLAAPGKRPPTFKVGSPLFDKEDMGYRDAGPFTFDTTVPGNSNSGHAYGAELPDGQRRELIEYLRAR